jgi:hypothetical protein
MADDELALNRLIDKCIYLKGAVKSPNFPESTVIVNMYNLLVRMQHAAREWT